jgi:ATP adenylyltransferase
MVEYLWTSWRMSYIEGLNGRPTECVFCAKLDAGDQDELVLHRGDDCYVCLNRFPYTSGHLLIVPNEHVATIEALSPDVLLEMMTLCQTVLGVLRTNYHPRGFNVGLNLGQVAGAGLPEHVHLHVVPRWAGDSNFMSVLGETRVLPEMLEESWCRLREAWDEYEPPDHE